MGKRIVWVLGAGFSVPLGGPMLKDLLSLESRRDIEDKHPQSNDPGVYWLYHYGRKFKDGWLSTQDPVGAGENLWEHAEDYLQQLDTAARDGAGVLAKRLSDVLTGYQRAWMSRKQIPYRAVELPAIAAHAKRYVAAECISFLDKSKASDEHWQPYQDWASKLGPQDVILTFNYDTVLERISGGRIGFILDADEWNAQESAHSAPRALKLHGSVNWRWDRAGNKIVRAADDFAESCKDDELVIATPGPSKQDAVSQKLHELWACAEEALSTAEVIVFIGYRFPRTDATARRRLLGAVRRNQSEELNLYSVLGPHSEDTARMTRMLELACLGRPALVPVASGSGGKVNPIFYVAAEPLWAQDFLDLWARERL